MNYLSERLHNTAKNLEQVSYSYEHLMNHIPFEIKRNSDIQWITQDVAESLKKIVDTTKKHSEWMQNVQWEYQQAEKRILQIYESIAQEKGGSFLKNKKKQWVRQLGYQQIQQTPYLCRLPKKEQIIESSIYAGLIQKGRNILIKTWTFYQ